MQKELTPEQLAEILELENKELKKALEFAAKELNHAVGVINKEEMWTKETLIEASKWD